MHSSPTLQTERLVLKQLIMITKRHVEWLNDPEVTQYSELRHKNHTIHSAQKWLWATTHVWGISLAENQKHIGNVAAYLDTPNRTAEMSIMVGEKDHWRQGYGVEAWKAVAEWLLRRDGGFRKIEAGCMANNLGMRKIMQKTGMLPEGERKLHFLYQSNPVGLLMYGRFA